MPTTSAYIVVFLVAVGATFLLTPVLRIVAARTGVLAQPTDRAVHAKPIPYLGGVAMLGGFLLALGVAWRMHGFAAVFDGSSLPLGVALGAIVLCAVGTL